MRRRQLITAAGLAVVNPLAGCINGPLDRSGSVPGDRDEAPVEPMAGSHPDPPSGCGPASQPLSALLTDESGDGEACFEGARPSLAVENEREETITVAVTVTVDGNTGYEETAELDPGDRFVDSNAFGASDGVSGTVQIVDEAPVSVVWPERSCRRHGIAISNDGVAIGWVEPLQGPGDTQHDCYPGEIVPLEIHSAGEARSVSVTIEDRCAENTYSDSLELEADETHRIDGTLESGGMYDVTIDVVEGGSETYEFHEGCWGVAATIRPDGEIRIDQFGID